MRRIELPKPPVILALCAAAALLVGHALYFNFVNDDAYISFRYADNLVRHGELVYNPGERVEGYTNFLWTVTMAAFMGLGGDPVFWSRVLGIGFGLGGMWLVYRFLAKFRGEGHGIGQGRLVDTLGPLWLAATPAFACWSTGGLETQQFTFFATLGWTAYLLEEQAKPKFRWSGVYFALSALARPEGMLFFGLTGVHRLVSILKPPGRRPTDPDEPPPAPSTLRKRRLPSRNDLLWGAGFVAVFGPYFAWRWTYYGWPLPNTYYVKAGSDSFWGPGLQYYWTWVRDHDLFVWPVFVVLAARVRGLWPLLGLLFVGLSVHVMKIGGDFMGLHRFLVPLMPMLAVVLSLGVEKLLARLAEGGVSMRIPAAVGVVLALALGYQTVRTDRWAMQTGSEGGVDRIGWLKMFEGQCRAIGLYLRDNAAPDATLATTAAGIIPYYSRLYTVDILGLNDEYIAHEVPARGSRPGHTKVAPHEYLMKKQIDYLVYHPTISERAISQADAARTGSPGRDYVWESVQVPDLAPPYWGYWFRKTAKAP